MADLLFQKTREIKHGRVNEMIKVDKEFRDLIPPIGNEEVQLLEKSLLNEGCRDPLVVWEGILVDGHNRHCICTKYGIPYNVVERHFSNRDEAKSWIINNQLARRNLTPEQRNYLIGKQYRERKAQGVRTDLTSHQNEEKLTTAEKVAKEHKIGKATVERAAKFAEAVDTIAENVGEDVRHKILGREINLTAKDVQRVVSMEPEQQKQVIEKIVTGRAKSVVDARRQLRKNEVREAPPLEGKYRVIYADPPWKYGDERDGSTTGATDHYPTMSIQELCELPVRDIAEENAVLFLWVTSPLLEECFEVIKAWGFKYKSSFVWDKVRHNMGHYNSVRHELLLVCTRGSCTPDEVKLFDSVQSIERTEHSKKPEEFRDIIDTLYTHGNKIELFARRPVEGWEVWGNEPNITG